MRNLLIFIALVVIYYVIKALVRSAIKGYHEGDSARPVQGEEMVLDPECGTYVVKDRAITRRIKGKTYFFCSEACAQRYEEKAGR